MCHPSKNPAQVQFEYEYVFNSLLAGNPTPSHIWLVIVQKDIPDREWSFDQLPAWLSLCEAKSQDVEIRKLWSDTLNRKPSIRQGTGNVRTVLRGGTAINLTDFILACCQDKALLDKHELIIAKTILYPFNVLRARRRGLTQHTRKMLRMICQQSHDCQQKTQHHLPKP